MADKLKMEKTVAISMGGVQLFIAACLVVAMVLTTFHWAVLIATLLCITSGSLAIAMGINPRKCTLLSAMAVGVLCCSLLLPIIGYELITRSPWMRWNPWMDCLMIGDDCYLNTTGTIQFDNNETCWLNFNYTCVANPNITHSVTPICLNSWDLGDDVWEILYDDYDDDDDDDDDHVFSWGLRRIIRLGIMCGQFFMALGQVILVINAFCSRKVTSHTALKPQPPKYNAYVYDEKKVPLGDEPGAIVVDASEKTGGSFPALAL